MKKRSPWIGVVLLGLLAGWGVASCNSSGRNESAISPTKASDDSLILAATEAPAAMGANPDNDRCEPVGAECSLPTNPCCANEECIGRCFCTGETCSGVCTNEQTDPNNCGSCGHVCAGGDACCSASCVNEQTSSTNCGACGNVCNSGESCYGGACVFPAGWLFTSGNGIYKSTGPGGGTSPRWMGRGVNIDDIFFGGYNSNLTMDAPDSALETIVSGLMSGWSPSFIRVSLYLFSYTTVGWVTGTPGAYQTEMTNVINWIHANYPTVYVLVTLRSHQSMIDDDTGSGDPEATYLPSNSTNTPSSTEYPTGTDSTYVALVDSFSDSSFVLFGISNEPGGNTLSSATIAGAMSHAVGVIRAEENRLGVPHHTVSVQGNDWTSDLSYYATSPLSYDNVVYEYHGYQPLTSSYTYSSIPVIVGEYGPDPATGAFDSSTFYGNVETNKIPNLAWDFEPYLNIAPDLLEVTASPTDLIPADPWGVGSVDATVVQSYLLDP